MILRAEIKLFALFGAWYWMVMMMMMMMMPLFVGKADQSEGYFLHDPIFVSEWNCCKFRASNPQASDPWPILVQWPLKVYLSSLYPSTKVSTTIIQCCLYPCDSCTSRAVHIRNRCNGIITYPPGWFVVRDAQISGLKLCCCKQSLGKPKRT